MSSQKTAAKSEYVTELNPNDVLMGRGPSSSEYSGNIRFRQLVIDRRDEYLEATRRADKHQISRQIIARVHKRGGRFLVRITTSEEAQSLGVPPGCQAWTVVEAHSKPLFIKVKQLMRDVGTETQEKRKRRRAEKRNALEYRQPKQDEDEQCMAWGPSSKPSSAQAAVSYQKKSAPSSQGGNHDESEEGVSWERELQQSRRTTAPPAALGESEGIATTRYMMTQRPGPPVQQTTISPQDPRLATLLEALLQQSQRQASSHIVQPQQLPIVTPQPAPDPLAPLLAELATRLTPPPPPPPRPSALDANSLPLNPRALQAVELLFRALQSTGR